MKANYSIAEWQQGYHLTQGQLCCNYCSQQFAPDQVAGMTTHLQTAHGGSLQAVLTTPDSANTLTAKQRELLTSFAARKNDAELADELDVTTSTIRHQRFTFRQKAAQAQLYLAQYQSVFGAATAHELLRLPKRAQSLGITAADSEQTLHQYLDGEHITRWPRKEKLRVILCLHVLQSFSAQQLYTHAETAALLGQFSADYNSLARYLIDYDLLARTPDGQYYWRIFN